MKSQADTQDMSSGKDAVLHPIGWVENDFPEKFGLPRQSGLAEGIRGRVVFEKPYRQPEAFRGLEGYDRIWLLWGFDAREDGAFHATVRPPQLGGNTRTGVFATRSPFRPNPIGLSCVALEGIRMDPDLGPVLYVAGLDMKNGTPVWDVKPYLPYADAWPEARSGFASPGDRQALTVSCPEKLLQLIPEDKRPVLLEALRADPRPAYKRGDGEGGMAFAGCNVRFQITDRHLTVLDIREDRE